MISESYNSTAGAYSLQNYAKPEIQLSGLQKMYSLSFLWMREAIAGVTILASTLISFIAGFRKVNSVPYNLVHPWLRGCFNLSDEKALPTSGNGHTLPTLEEEGEYHDVKYEMTPQAKSCAL